MGVFGKYLESIIMATTEESTPPAGTGLNRSRSTRLQDVKQRMKDEIQENKKKGFMTPERKKKLRVMLTNYAKKKIKRGTRNIRKKEKRNCSRTSWRAKRHFKTFR